VSRELRAKLEKFSNDLDAMRATMPRQALEAMDYFRRSLDDILAPAEDAPPAATLTVEQVRDALYEVFGPMAHDENGVYRSAWIDDRRSKLTVLLNTALAAQPPQAPQEQTERVPTITFDGTFYDCARCGNHQTVLCEHWQALFERAYASIEASAKPKEPGR